MVAAKLTMTLTGFEAFLARPENTGRRFELIDGEPVEKMVSEVHGILVMYLGAMLLNYTLTNPVARVTTEVHHHAPKAPETIYQPDIAVTRYDRALPPSDEIAVPLMPDLAIEVKSLSNTYKELREKAEYYLAHGSTLVWLVIPSKRLIEVYRLEGDLDILTDADSLDGGHILPGFKLSVQAVFDSVR